MCLSGHIHDVLKKVIRCPLNTVWLVCTFSKYIIFWLEREEVIGGWRKVHNEGLSDLYLPKVMRMIK
jgi:hypothetical protein